MEIAGAQGRVGGAKELVEKRHPSCPTSPLAGGGRICWSGPVRAGRHEGEKTTEAGANRRTGKRKNRGPRARPGAGWRTATSSSCFCQPFLPVALLRPSTLDIVGTELIEVE